MPLPQSSILGRYAARSSVAVQYEQRVARASIIERQ
jgi:hypothetical protein